jgi:hypothetical protein
MGDMKIKCGTGMWISVIHTCVSVYRYKLRKQKVLQKCNRKYAVLHTVLHTRRSLYIPDVR